MRRFIAGVPTDCLGNPSRSLHDFIFRILGSNAHGQFCVSHAGTTELNEGSHLAV